MKILWMYLYSLCLSALLSGFAARPVRAADYWVAASDASVVTNNDCGAVSAVSGEPVVRRSFHSADEQGISATVADRINSGDEVVVPPGSRLEMTCGANVVLVLGGGGRARLGGLRNFTDPENKPVVRLDVEMLEGEMRVQVRLHEQKPMAVLIQLNGAEVLVRRGDVEVAMRDGWRAAVLSGSATARLRRSGVAGAPFVIAERRVVGSGGDEPLADVEAAAIMQRVPFLFETRSAALPPLPHASGILEAP